jgi:hypothetical protein
MIMISVYMTLGQILLVAGLHFSMLRIVILCGFVRLVIRKELHQVRLNIIDKVVLVWAVSSIILHTLLVQTYDGFIYMCGFAYNWMGLYFFFRAVVRDFSDMDRTLKTLCLLMVPLAMSMIGEKITGRNLFSIFGGVPELTGVRDGRIRCVGPFRHPILAGLFGATSMPLMVSLYFRRKVPGLIGFFTATIIVVLSASSGPVVAYVLALVALLLWPFRRNMREILWGGFAGLLILHFVIMKDPVWHIIARISDVTGGTGWHRAFLIDQAINHFNEWWLLGTTHTAHWMPYALRNDPTSADITNQFIWEGINGGLIRMLLFISIIVLSYQTLGKAMRYARARMGSVEIPVWCMGCVLFAHITAFLSVSYFDQMVVFWFLLLAMISTIRDLTDRSICLNE